MKSLLRQIWQTIKCAHGHHSWTKYGQCDYCKVYDEGATEMKGENYQKREEQQVSDSRLASAVSPVPPAPVTLAKAGDNDKICIRTADGKRYEVVVHDDCISVSCGTIGDYLEISPKSVQAIVVRAC